MPITLPTIMSYDDWMRDTATSNSRSDRIKALDEAIAGLSGQMMILKALAIAPNLERNHLCTVHFKYYFDRIALAWKTWKAWKGTSYLASKRNKVGAVGKLEKQIWTANNWLYTDSDSDLIEWWKEQIDEQYKQIFAGSKLGPRSMAVLGKMAEISKVHEFPEQLRSLIDIVRNETFFHEGSPEAQESRNILAAMLEDLCSRALKAFGIDNIPLLSAVVNIGIAMKDARSAYLACKNTDLLLTLGKRLNEGDTMSSVISAIQAAMSDRAAFLATSSLRHTAKGIVGVLNLASMGAGQGLNTAVSLCDMITSVTAAAYQLAQEVKQAVTVNKLMKYRSITRDLFVQCPLLGAYYIALADTSALAVLLVDFGHAGWMDDVEKLRKGELESVRQMAKTLIDESSFELTMLDGTLAKVKIDRTMLQKAKDTVVNAVTKKGPPPPVKYPGLGYDSISS